MKEFKDFKRVGYHGKDSMREKAKKAFGSSMTMDMEPKRSRSEPSKIKPRLYAEGGDVSSDEPKMKRGGSHKAKGLKTPPLNVESVRQAKCMGSKKRCYNDGGEVADARLLGSNPATWSPNAEADGMQNRGPMALKKGGKAQRKAGGGTIAEGYAMGGVGKIRHGQSTKSGKPKIRRIVKGR